MESFKALEPGDPEQVGQYRVVARLGAGGMGRVYLGRSRAGRLFAVKVVRPELAEDPVFRARFAREVAAARLVNGVYTAGVVDADPEGFPPWLATAYVPGMSLDTAIAEFGAWPEEPLTLLAAALAEALEAIHAAGVVHRDLKPSNILLAEDGPRVIDFGISRTFDMSTTLTRTGFVLRTPGFASPEQLTAGPVGPPSDVFSLGVVLAITASGTSPFEAGSEQGQMYRIVYEDPDLDAVPGRLLPLVVRCLAKRPEDRPGLPELLDVLTGATGPRHATLAFAGSGWLPETVARALRDRRETPPGAGEPADAIPGAGAPGAAATPTAGPAAAATPGAAATGDDVGPATAHGAVGPGPAGGDRPAPAAGPVALAKPRPTAPATPPPDATMPPPDVTPGFGPVQVPRTRQVPQAFGPLTPGPQTPPPYGPSAAPFPMGPTGPSAVSPPLPPPPHPVRRGPGAAVWLGVASAIAVIGLLAWLIPRQLQGVSVGGPGASPSASTEAGSGTSAVLGTWRGNYVCNQGLTGLVLTIRKADGGGDGDLEAVFSFYPSSANPTVPRGSFAMVGSFAGSTLDLEGDHWIDQPPGYVMVNLKADYDETVPNHLDGSVVGANCTSFSVDRSS